MKSLKNVRLFAWADESGNSGLNIFDQGQPMFWSGTMLSPTDLDMFPSPHTEWLSTVKAKELHGKELHFYNLNKIAASVKEFLHQHECRFVFTRIDKEYHAVTTLMAMILDSDTNKGVQPIHDHVPIFRKQLTNGLMPFLTRRERQGFWTSYMHRDLENFGELLLNLELRISESCPDKRAAQVYCDAFAWARRHPGEVMESGMSNQDSPNHRSLILLIDGLHKMAGDNARIIRFRHDEQPEFRKTLMEDFELLKNVRGPLGNPYAALRPHTIEEFDCQLEMIPSTSSVGLQLIDVLLYLVSRHLNGSYYPRDDSSGALLNYIRSQDRAIINQMVYSPENDFTFADLEAMAESSSLFQADAPSFEDFSDQEKAGKS